MESYFDPKSAASFAGADAFRKSLKGKFTGKEIDNWLQKQDAYTLHKPTRKNFKRRRTFASGIDSNWQCDLVDVSSLTKYNDQHKFILTCIDVFSKNSWAVPLKTKTGPPLCEAFSKVKQNRHPSLLQTDKGTEFVNRHFQKFMRDNGIHFYTSENDDIKASIAERFNRTLKSKMWRYFTHNNTYRYLDILQHLVDSYNKTHHRSIGMAPMEVTLDNEALVRSRLYGAKKTATATASAVKWKFRVGDRVRISKNRAVFEKSYLPSWTEEIFVIVARLATEPVTYELEDAQGEKLKGTFYEPELQLVLKEDGVFKIEKIIKTRTREGKTQYLVKWKGYQSKFNSWVDNIFAL